MIHAIALDDEPLGLQVIETMTSEYDFLSLDKTFTRPSEALAYIEQYQVDVIFLDIKMPAMSGTDFAQKISKEVMVVFTTAYDNYALESYDLNAIDYIMKPISRQRFKQAVEKIKRMYDLSKMESGEEHHILIRADLSTIKLPVKDILYIEGMADYLKIYVPGRKPIVTRMTVKSIVDLLPAEEFIRIHRSFVVPISRIVAIKSKSIVLPEKEIPVGNTYLKTISELLK